MVCARILGLSCAVVLLPGVAVVAVKGPRERARLDADRAATGKTRLLSKLTVPDDGVTRSILAPPASEWEDENGARVRLCRTYVLSRANHCKPYLHANVTIDGILLEAIEEGSMRIDVDHASEDITGKKPAKDPG